MVFEGYQPGYGFFNSFGALTRPLLQKGSRGPAVTELQKLLEEKLQRSVGVDGQFGSRTETAVLEFQRTYGGVLPINGIVDADTWTALLGQEVKIASSGPSGDGIPANEKEKVINEGDMTFRPYVAPKMSTPLLVGVGAAIVAAIFLLRK
jgi:peptidoglycan hydrolase-like protein with peptidoglycan-binding domain